MKNSFLYIIDYDYDSYECHGCGHCSGDYDDYCCRSEEYEGLVARFNYKSFMMSTTNGMSLLQKYCVDRLISIYELYNDDKWDIGAELGYYGEEIAYITMNDFDEFILDYNYIKKAENKQKLINFILNREYGIINNNIINISIKEVSKSDIIVTENMKLGNTNYKINDELPIGIYTEINGKYKLIDGRHRYSICKNNTVQIILV